MCVCVVCCDVCVMTGTLRVDSVCVCAYVCVCELALQHNQLWSRQSHERCLCEFRMYVCVVCCVTL